MAITSETVLAQVPGVLGADVDEHHVLLNRDLDYLGLDPVGRRVWDLVKEPITFSELVGALVSEFDVTPEQCEADLAPFVESLASNQLITIG